MNDRTETAQRYWRGQEHRARALGYGGTSEGVSLWATHVDKLAAALKQEIDAPSKSRWQRRLKRELGRVVYRHFITDGKPDGARSIAAATLWAFVSSIVDRP